MKPHRRSILTCLLALLLAGLPIMPGSASINAVARPPIDAGHSPGASPSLFPLGLNFAIALHTGQNGVRGKPGVAFDGTLFFVPWSEGSDVYAARVSPEGNVLDSPPITISHGLNEAVAQPSVAFDGTHYFLAWLATRSGVNEVYGARVTPGGDVLDPAGIQITTGGDPRIRMPAIAFDGTDFLVAWRTRSDHIYGARVSPAGANLDAPAGFPIAQVGTSYYPAVAFDGTNYLVVWHDRRNAGLSGWDVFGARVTPQGHVLDPNGFVICEIFGFESGGWPHRLGAMMPAIGALAPFIWTGGKAQFWLAVPTSVFGMALIPIAYCAFLLVMNQKKLLGENMPRGGKRLTWNVLMVVAIAWTGFGSMYAVWSKSHWYGVALVMCFILLAVVVHFVRRRNQREVSDAG